MFDEPMSTAPPLRIPHTLAHALHLAQSTLLSPPLAARPSGHPPTLHPSLVHSPPHPLGLQSKSFKGRYQNPNLFIQMPLQSAVQREIARRSLAPAYPVAAANLTWNVGLVTFPHPAVATVRICGSRGAWGCLAAGVA